MIDVTFSHFETVAPNIKTLWFKPTRPVRYIAGQFTELHLPHDPADERGIRRWFTLSSSPTEPLLAITTRFTHPQSSSFKRQLAGLRPGAQLKLADPMGDFVLPKDPAIPLVFVAAGLGITPVRTMIKWLYDKAEQRDIRLLYAVSDPADMAFGSLFRAYKLALTPIVKTKGQTLTLEQILQNAGSDRLIYLSGPEPMTEHFYKALKKHGITEERLITDYFPGYSEIG